MVEVGTIQLSSTTQLKVSVSRYNGELGIDVRKYIESDNYTGWGKGVRLHKNAIDSLVYALSNTDLTEKEYNTPFARIAKSVDIDVLVQISTFSGLPKLDIREELTTKNGKFFTPKGVSVPLSEVVQFLEMLREAQWAYDNF